MSEDVGARLRVVRTVRGLSQRALAKRCGVANATISLIETGTISPTVGSLKRGLRSRERVHAADVLGNRSGPGQQLPGFCAYGVYLNDKLTLAR